MLDSSLMTDYPGRGVVSLLWEAADIDPHEPRTLTAAEQLKERFDGDGATFAVLISGTLVRSGRPVGQTETDGPMGAAVLARALFRAFGTIPILLTLDPAAEVMRAAMQAMGFGVITTDDAGLADVLADSTVQGSKTAIVCSLQPGLRSAITLGEQLFTERGDVGAVVAVEMVGRNEHGVAHSASGVAKSDDLLPWFDEIVRAAVDAKVLTIGIGDGGNELGTGNIKEALDRSLPGARCKCPCGGTIVPAQVVDLYVPSSISNWGAYAIAANLAAMQDDLSVLIDVEVEAHLLDAVVLAGAVDGTTGLVEHRVDGLTAAEDVSYVHLLRALVRTNSNTWALL